MPYVAPNTFVAGTVTDAADVAENIADAREYVNDIDVADLAASGILTKHVVRARLFQQSDLNRGMVLALGSEQQTYLPPVEVTTEGDIRDVPANSNGFICKPFTEDAGDGSFQTVTKMAMSFYVADTSKVLVWWGGEIWSPDDDENDQVTSDGLICLDGVPDTGSRFHLRQMESGISALEDFDRRPFQTFACFTGVAAGWHTVDVRVGLNCNIAVTGTSYGTVSVFD